jgi:hypothetical protein
MKHLFTIHSPITYFTAINIIFQEKIPHEDVIIVTDGYKVPIEIGKLVKSFQNLEDSLWKKIRKPNVVKAFDKYITKITGGGDFIAYLDLIHAYQRIILTHDKCLSFNFIEEGTASYVIPNNLYLITHGASSFSFRNTNFKQLSLSIIRVLRGTNIRLLSLPFQPLAYSYLPNIKYYTFSEFGYPGVMSESKIILDVNNIKDSFLNNFNLDLKYDNSVIWVEEAFPEYYGVTEKDYRDAILKVINNLEKNVVSEIFFKLRPKKKTKDSFLFQILSKTHLKITLIPDHILVEMIFLKSKKITVIGIVSSLLFYASIFGHKSYSFYDLIKNKPQSPFDFMEFYWSTINKISSKNS